MALTARTINKTGLNILFKYLQNFSILQFYEQSSTKWSNFGHFKGQQNLVVKRVKGRYFGESIRLISDTLEYTENNDVPGI